MNSTPGDARVNGEQPPHVSLVAPRSGAADPTLVVVWTAKGAMGTTLMTARSTDGGRTFSRTAIVPGTDAAGNRGWEATAVDKSGRLNVIWLDHRELAQGDSMGDMSHHMDPNMSASMKMDSVAKAQLSKLYFARLGDGSAPRAIAAGVCYCCKTALAVGPDGSVYAAWRHVYPGNLRDIAFTVSRDGGHAFAPPVRVSEDKWEIDGYPENGPAIAVDGQNHVHVVWPTLVGQSNGSAGALALFYTVSRDGRQFAPRQTLPTEGTPRHVQMAVARDGSLAIVWDETVDNVRRVVYARGSIASDGHVQFRRQVLGGSESAVYPALAVTPNGLFVAAVSGAAADSVIRFTRIHTE